MRSKSYNKLTVSILCLVMSALSFTSCQDDGLYSASKVKSDLSMADDVAAYYDAVDMDYAYDLSYELAYNWDELAEPLGWRTAGSDSEHRTADYLADEMRKIGLQNVEKLPTTCDKFQNNGTSLIIEGTDVVFKGGSQKDVEAETNGPAPYHVNGTDGDLTTEIIDVGSGYEADYEGRDVKGKIVMAQVDQSNNYWIDSYMHEAANHGAAALVTWANSGYGEIDTTTTNVQDVCCGDIIPTVAISADQAERIKDALADGHNECTFNMDTEMLPKGGTTYNVCGRIPGRNHDEKIIVSGHYDKYWYGFQDDCAAIGLVFAVAKAMLDSGYEPEYDMYFICHGAEEWGVTDSLFDWTAGARGMVTEYNMADNVRAMFNFELPAYKPDNHNGISSVPEFVDMVATMLNSGLVVTSGDSKINVDTRYTNTMEDGIEYREFGTPYFTSFNGGSSFMSERYHTEADNAETYDEDSFRTNINWTGAFAIYFDQEPAIELNIASAAAMLREDFNKDYSAEAGVDTEEYLAAVDEMEKAGQALYDKAVVCNANYEAALVEDDEQTIEACRKEARTLNRKSLDAFQLINEQLLKVNDSTAEYGHPQYYENVELLDNIIRCLNDGVIWTDDETGAGDYAWQLNNALEYSYMSLGMKNADRQIEANSQSHYATRYHAQWGWNHMYEHTRTGVASYELLRAETIADIADVDAMISIYQAARKDQMGLIKSESARELVEIKNITENMKK